MAEQWLDSVKAQRHVVREESPDLISALAMAKGEFGQAEALLSKRIESARDRPREDRYRLVVYGLYDQLGRARLGLRKWGEAKVSFEQAIATMNRTYVGNPYLAATRARYGLCLLALGDRDGAAHQAELAKSALRRHRLLAKRFQEPLNQLMTALAGKA